MTTRVFRVCKLGMGQETTAFCDEVDKKKQRKKKKTFSCVLGNEMRSAMRMILECWSVV